MKKDKTIFICDVEATVGGTFPDYASISYRTVDKLEYLEEQNREYRQLVERFHKIAMRLEFFFYYAPPNSADKIRDEVLHCMEESYQLRKKYNDH